MSSDPQHRAPGRPAGAISKRTARALEILNREKFCPLTALIKTHRDAYRYFYADRADVESGVLDKRNDQSAVWLKIAADTASDIVAYAHPKLKSIEQRQASPIEDLTPEEKLQHVEVMAEELRQEIAKKNAGLLPEKVEDE